MASYDDPVNKAHYAALRAEVARLREKCALLEATQNGAPDAARMQNVEDGEREGKARGALILVGEHDEGVAVHRQEELHRRHCQDERERSKLGSSASHDA